MNKLNLGVVGIGHLGSLHAKMLSEIPSVRLAGLYDINRERAQSCAVELGTEAHNAYDALINNRQDTAHREGANVTFSDIKRFYKDSIPVLETIEEILGPKKIT